MPPQLHSQDLQTALRDHLAWWGLRRFVSDSAYYQWQRESLPAPELAELNRLAEEKRAPEARAAQEIAFYDFAARPHILPVLYSQQYDYCLTVGPAVAERVQEARSILEFGCGIGLLTTFYARQFSDASIVGVDRSPASIAVARERAQALGLRNVRFDRLDVEREPLTGAYDLIICTHALLQAERDPGLPSLTWQTFERANDPRMQSDFERRTGLQARLDSLCGVLTSHGRLILLEKTRQLARRVPFQRALAARGLKLLDTPIPIRYQDVEEVTEDGPLLHLGRQSGATFLAWDEGPERADEDELYHCSGQAARQVWERLPQRAVLREARWTIPDLGPVRAEWGTSSGVLSYLYVVAGSRFAGILVGSSRGGVELDCRFGRAVERAGLDPTRLRDLLQSTWPIFAGQEGPEDLNYLLLYENHTVTAQDVWSGLPDHQILKASTFEEPDGRQKHIELGTVSGLTYLYWANTSDQRQLAVVEPRRAHLLEQYYQESVADS